MAAGWPGRPRTTRVGNIDDAFVLDIRVFRRSGAIQPGRVTQGLLRGAQGGFGGADVQWTLDLKNPLYGRLTVTGEVQGRRIDQTVEVAPSPCRYGGRRYWLVCGSSRARACALALSGGQFVCRAAARLSYACQSETELYRLARAARKAEARAFGLDGHPHPRGRRRERLEARYRALEDGTEAAVLAWVQA